jgi:sn-glycerol 3-phosphate transport system ATP-binding protein
LEPAERDIAMVFQNYALYPHMSVFDNMAYGLKIAKVSIEEIKKRVQAAASALELSHLLERKPRELSGGQRQRVAMGRAIVRQPQVFLFDEPLSNLDAKLRAHTRLEIQKLHRELETTSLFVTHDQVEAMTLAQRMLVMHEGRVQQFGTPEEVYNRPANTFVAGFIGAPPMNLLHEVSGIDTGKILGIRPEHLHIKNTSHPENTNDVYSWLAQVYALEMLGAERLVYARIGQEDIVVRTDVTADIPLIGGAVKLIAEHHQVHWFDKKTGLRQK